MIDNIRKKSDHNKPTDLFITEDTKYIIGSAKLNIANFRLTIIEVTLNANGIICSARISNTIEKYNRWIELLSINSDENISGVIVNNIIV